MTGLPAPGSRAAACFTTDGWTCTTEFGDKWYHISNCSAFAESKFGCKDACIMCVVAPGAPRGKEAEFALAYCNKDHKVGAPQHALVAKRTEFLAALDSTMAQKRPKLRQGAVKAGLVVGKRPGGKSGRFSRQTARP